MKQKILFLEDHQFWANEVIEFLRDDLGYEVKFVTSYSECHKLLEADPTIYDYSIVDLILQNGKSGMDIVQKYKSKMGRIVFVTSCIDKPSLDTIKAYPSIAKIDEVLSPLKRFLNDTNFDEHVVI